MLTIRRVTEAMEELAPLELAYDWDNVGLQIGSPAREVSAILITLTITKEVLARAVDSAVDLIVAHHPLIFEPLRSIRTDHFQGALISRLLKEEIGVYVSHTNLDVAPQGLNHWLAELLGLENTRVLIPHLTEGAGLGRLGGVKPVSLGEIAARLGRLWPNRLRVIGDEGRSISQIAVIGGSGGKYAKEAKDAGAQLLITGDVSYHNAVDALEMGLAVIDAGHFATEKIMVPRVKEYLQKSLGPQVKISGETGSSPF